MISQKDIDTYYEALIKRDKQYEGLFYVGVKTTGIFCRPTCSARKPKRENCLFFDSVQAALLEGFRPCERCCPLSAKAAGSELVDRLINLVNASPNKRWKEADLKHLGIDPSTASRQFKKRFKMTFIEYARSIRLGEAIKCIKSGGRRIDAQLESGYESDSGFRDAFTKTMGQPLSEASTLKVLDCMLIDTQLGPMMAIADKEALLLLEFTARRGLEKEIYDIRRQLKAVILPADNPILDQIKRELLDYFKGDLHYFKTPIKMRGSEFQQMVWHALCEIPYGETCSYLALAKTIKRPTACRAVARANGTNPLALIVPCHRVINQSGELGGYGGGISRKAWLLAHERQVRQTL